MGTRTFPPGTLLETIKKQRRSILAANARANDVRVAARGVRAATAKNK